MRICDLLLRQTPAHFRPWGFVTTMLLVLATGELLVGSVAFKAQCTWGLPLIAGAGTLWVSFILLSLPLDPRRVCMISAAGLGCALLLHIVTIIPVWSIYTDPRHQTGEFGSLFRFLAMCLLLPVALAACLTFQLLVRALAFLRR